MPLHRGTGNKEVTNFRPTVKQESDRNSDPWGPVLTRDERTSFTPSLCRHFYGSWSVPGHLPGVPTLPRDEIVGTVTCPTESRTLESYFVPYKIFVNTGPLDL